MKLKEVFIIHKGGKNDKPDPKPPSPSPCSPALKIKTFVLVNARAAA